MREHKGVKYHLIDSPGIDKGRVFMYALEGDKTAKQLKAQNNSDAEKEVKLIIEKLKR